MTQPPRVDLFDAAFKADPYPTYAQLRSTAPVHHTTLPDGRGVWLVTRYEDVLAIFKDERFIKDWRKVMTPEQLAQIPPIPDVMEPLSQNMLDTDPQTTSVSGRSSPRHSRRCSSNRCVPASRS